MGEEGCGSGGISRKAIWGDGIRSFACFQRTHSPSFFPVPCTTTPPPVVAYSPYARPIIWPLEDGRKSISLSPPRSPLSLPPSPPM
ncbi:hypothetical protein DAI22_05g093501 [Oryza sativa Japonica Group]|nr:hypothetical protein DAI22_05g093501 [Oryza sativa Japonica Group]